MAKTTNLSLELTEDDSIKFKTWRETVNGNNAADSKSNAQIIDSFAGDVNTKFTEVNTKLTQFDEFRTTANTKLEEFDTFTNTINTDIDTAVAKADTAVSKAETATTKADTATTKADSAYSKVDAVDSKVNTAVGKLDSKATEAKEITITINTTDWIDKSATVTVNEVSTSSIIFVSPASESYLPYTSSRIRATQQADKTLTFACDEMPTENVVINLVILNTIVLIDPK